MEISVASEEWLSINRSKTVKVVFDFSGNYQRIYRTNHVMKIRDDDNKIDNEKPEILF